MVVLCSNNKLFHNPVKHGSKQKRKTWKFAAEFLWRKSRTNDQVELGLWTRDQLVELGPTFIKLGQIVSSRVDLYPIEFTQQLESLQDNVNPIDEDTISRIKLKNDIFSEFELTPFKSASIGQVHKAKLLNGKNVIVKIKRPQIYNIIKNDTDNIREIIQFMETIGVNTGTNKGEIFDETVQYLLGETDYEQELKNASVFRKNMKDVSWIKVPKVYNKYSTPDMIVMEYVESEKITDITNKNVNKKKVCEAIISSYVFQTLEKGCFHADPHPGNLGFSKNGKLVFYDFGLLIDISDELKEGFKKLFVYIINKDTKGIVDIFIKLNIILPTTSDLSDIELFFKTTLNYLETLDGSSLRDEILGDELLLSLAKNKPFVIPTPFIYLAKTFSTIEGTCVRLDPDFNYYEYLEPVIRDQVSDVLDLGDMVSTSMEMPSRIRNISTAILGLEESRSVTKRILEKTRKEIQYTQYSVLAAVFAGNIYESGGTPVAFIAMTMLSFWFAFISQKTR